ncbi:peroxiredoxin family protein [Propioniciclava tarda]|uniref:thioredoxin-dependent peroxiredoxin n=1 Tax=Propioniciclava tarda TaxID=433330 RepID=A0A4V2JSY0_PROTD|nr:peroxiredoxin family protein [Propioniciclava tarda]TBT93128.1 peroxiredoxin family protein [Propioniciclava tarda]SMO77650.1 Peroxiredoxin [Propioniciclava tarda]
MSTKQHHAEQQHNARRELQQTIAGDSARQAQRRSVTRVASVAAAIVAVGLVVFGLWSAQPTNVSGSSQAPAFTLKTTAGTSVSLADYRGKPVILYFNEGAGCGACTQQMAGIEKNPGFAQAGIVVLPIVMNTAAQIKPDLDRFGVKTPYLLDDGTVSKAYGTLGKGMHADLPGHGFVLIDANGVQRWQGNYPSMWLDPATLLNEVKSRL